MSLRRLEGAGRCSEFVGGVVAREEVDRHGQERNGHSYRREVA